MLIYRFILLVAITLAITLPASAVVVFTEHFPTTSGNVSVHGWNASHSAANVDITNLPNVSGNDVFNRAGSISNSGAGSDPAQAGYLFAQSYARSDGQGTITTPATDYFLYTTSQVTTPISLLGHQSLTANWQQSSSNLNVGVRFAIQLDNGNWYVDSTPNINAVTGGATSFVGQSADLLTSSWYALNFETGVMNPDTTTTLTYNDLLLAGSEITGVGFYIEDLPAASATSNTAGTVQQGFTTMRVDQVIIDATAVPEPSRAILLGLGVLGVMMNRKRRINVNRA